MDVVLMNKVIRACRRARVKTFKWEGVEIIFDNFERPTIERQVELSAKDTQSPEALKKHIDALAKLQEEVETEMNIINDPLAWEQEATSGKE